MQKRMMFLLTMMSVMNTHTSERSGLPLLATTLAVGTAAYLLLDPFTPDSEILASGAKKLTKFAKYKEDIDAPPMVNDKGDVMKNSKKQFTGIEDLLIDNLSKLGMSVYDIDDSFFETMEQDAKELHSLEIVKRSVRGLFSNTVANQADQLKTYAAHSQQMTTLFGMHSNYIKGLAISNFYKILPDINSTIYVSSPGKSKLVDWVKQQVQLLENQNAVEKQQHPVSFYIKKAQKDCAWIDRFSSIDNSLPAHLAPSEEALVIHSRDSLRGGVDELSDSVHLLYFKFHDKKVETNPKLYPALVTALVANAIAIKKSTEVLVTTSEYSNEMSDKVKNNSIQEFDAYIAKSQCELGRYSSSYWPII